MRMSARGAILILVVAVAGVALLSWYRAATRPVIPRATRPVSPVDPPPAPSVTNAGPATAVRASVADPRKSTEVGLGAAAELPTLEINQAVVVTVELDFGTRVPTIAEALTEVERRYRPDDGVGRTFAVLDAFGEPTRGGKLHLSMHVSTEKPGVGWLVFKRTGQVLWASRLVLGKNQTPQDRAARGLTILLDDGAGKTLMIDGSSHPTSILDARLRDRSTLVRDAWPEGAEREVTFLYSACGCPVKVTCIRTGDRTVRTKDLPVLFPDDPAAAQTITRLMRW